VAEITDERLRELIDFHRNGHNSPTTSDGMALMSDMASALSELAMLRRRSHVAHEHTHDMVYDERWIPSGIREAIDAYVQQGRPPSDTVRAILSSDMREAFRRADVATARGMAAIAAYLYNRVPMTCYGSPKRVEQWLARHAALRAWSACVADMIEHFDPKTLTAEGHREPMLTTASATPYVGRFVGVERSKAHDADGLRFQLAIDWKVLTANASNLPLDLYVSLGQGQTYKVCLDEDSDRCVRPPDDDNMIVIYSYCLELGA
jgi:hypothetical protein